MKKLLFIAFAVFTMTGSFATGSSAAPIADLCTIYANQQAAYAQENGGNYYEAWFRAYGLCTGVINGN